MKYKFAHRTVQSNLPLLLHLNKAMSEPQGTNSTPNRDLNPVRHTRQNIEGHQQAGIHIVGCFISGTQYLKNAVPF